MERDTENTPALIAEILPAERVTAAAVTGEINAQVTTARAYPRSIKQFNDTAMSLATTDEEIASSMFYSIPRAGKKIEGASVRLAEVAAYAWGNLRVETNIESIDATHVTAVGTVFDCERNTAYRHRTKRRITDSRGRRYNDDMIVNACNAASSIAMRDAIFKAIPRSFIDPICEAAKATAIGDQKTLSARRGAAIEWFLKAGAHQEQLLKKLGRTTAMEITLDDLGTLQGWRTAIKDGALTIDTLFADEVSSEKAQELQQKLKAKKKDMNQGGTWPIPKDEDLPEPGSFIEEEDGMPV